MIELAPLTLIGGLFLGLFFMVALVASWFVIELRKRNLHLWLKDYLRSRSSRRPLGGEFPVVDIMVCVADHYEPRWTTEDAKLESERVAKWTNDLPVALRGRCDSDGKLPQHTFFYPYEEYRESLLTELTDLCRAGYGEIEIHLHHGNDTEATLKPQLEDFVQILHWQHGALGTHPETGAPGYAFVHGNWALNNSGGKDELCGVNDEIKVLLDTNCYVDMTLPSAPSDTQVDVANRIYYATSNKESPAGHKTGELVKAGSAAPSANHLMLITGPLGLNWSRRKMGIFPRIENGELANNAPCDPQRVSLWERLSSAVVGQPAWRFIKLHCHGVQEKDHSIMLGDDCREMYIELERQFRDRPGYRLHYVSAREMYNIACAAEAGETGNPNDYRDYVYQAPRFRSSESATNLSAVL